MISGSIDTQRNEQSTGFCFLCLCSAAAAIRQHPVRAMLSFIFSVEGGFCSIEQDSHAWRSPLGARPRMAGSIHPGNGLVRVARDSSIHLQGAPGVAATTAPVLAFSQTASRLLRELEDDGLPFLWAAQASIGQRGRAFWTL